MELSLDGPWKFFPVIENKYPDEAFYNSDFDDSGWKEMEVPSNWHTQGLDHNGKVLFRKRFSVPEIPENSVARLWFGGVDYYCRVWLNHELLGDHTGYFEHFEFNVTGLLRADSENLLAIEVNCPDDPGFPFAKKHFKGGLGHWDMRPGGWSTRGQEHGSGGIWQPVRLKRSGPCSIKKIIAAPLKKDDHWELGIEAELYSIIGGQAQISAFLAPRDFEGQSYDMEKSAVNLTRGENKWSGSIRADAPALWWTRDHGGPNLYELKISLSINGAVSEERTETIGFRTVEWRKDGLYLNGKRAYLRGSCYIGSIYLGFMTEELIRKDLDMAVSANMNCLRVPYHVEPDRFYDLCDEYGLLVQAEFPMLWDYDSSPESVNECGRQVRAMVEQLHNHPSIFKWVCHCEPASPGNRRMDRKIAAIARDAERTGRKVDKASKFTDHPFYGWYMGSKAGFAAQPGGPLPSEFGAESLPGQEARLWQELGEKKWPPNKLWAYHNFQKELAFVWEKTGSLDDMIESSQKYQADLLDFAIQSFRRGKGRIFGSYLFTYVDAWPSITWSIIDVDRNPKMAYHAVANAYKPLKLSIDFLKKSIRNPLTAPIFWNDRFDKGGEFFARIWVINDFHENYNAVLKWHAEGIISGEKEFKVNPDSAEVAVNISYHLPVDITEGEYRLIAELWLDGSLHDKEELCFFVTGPGGRRKNAIRAMANQARDDLRHVRWLAKTFFGHYYAFLAGGYRKKD